ncbi:hypothetical protein Aasi_0008 [Candidatus Amoebophilus asiaticus 5a2]|uniref:Uncharacterized protein n=1 Tax=Amoebophilus asiaticus (strain 5a2) TaxID=452471 RepID=B3EU46_AMOA5|nr:hypothetical protein [Candidatus Amoebophilus asiaticus]ACE05465.1 hypothetical protein Aasi_0008 [Candidatus Amoebophilus asiaticus 5a2]
MKVLKQIINKHMSLSLGTLFALMIMTGVTACESCNTKPSTDGKPSLSIKGGKEENGKIVFQDSEGKENRTVTVIVDLDDDSKSNSKSAIYANYLLNVTLKGADKLTYEGFDKQGKSVPSEVKSGETLTGETLEHFIKDAIDGTLESAHEIEFKFCPASDITEMEATFELRDKNNSNDSIDKKVVSWKAAEKPKDDRKDLEEKEGLLKEIEEKEAEIVAIENSIKQIKLAADSDVIGEVTLEQVDSVKAELDKAKASVEAIINKSDAIVANSADEEIKGRVAGNIQKAQQLLTQIQQIETQLASKLAHERPELLIEKVKGKKDFMDSQYAILKEALDKKKGLNLDTAKNVLVIIEKAKEEIETIAGHLNKWAGEDKEVAKQVEQAIKNAKSASNLANRARKGYEKVDKEDAIAKFENDINAATNEANRATTLLNSIEEGNLAEALKAIASAEENEKLAKLVLDTRLKSYLVTEKDKRDFQIKLAPVSDAIAAVHNAYNSAVAAELKVEADKVAKEGENKEGKATATAKSAEEAARIAADEAARQQAAAEEERKQKEAADLKILEDKVANLEKAHDNASKKAEADKKEIAGYKSKGKYKNVQERKAAENARVNAELGAAKTALDKARTELETFKQQAAAEEDARIAAEEAARQQAAAEEEARIAAEEAARQAAAEEDARIAAEEAARQQAAAEEARIEEEGRRAVEEAARKEAEEEARKAIAEGIRQAVKAVYFAHPQEEKESFGNEGYELKLATSKDTIIAKHVPIRITSDNEHVKTTLNSKPVTYGTEVLLSDFLAEDHPIDANADSTLIVLKVEPIGTDNSANNATITIEILGSDATGTKEVVNKREMNWTKGA